MTNLTRTPCPRCDGKGYVERPTHNRCELWFNTKANNGKGETRVFDSPEELKQYMVFERGECYAQYRTYWYSSGSARKEAARCLGVACLAAYNKWQALRKPDNDTAA